MGFQIDLQPILGSDGVQERTPSLQVGSVNKQFDSPALQQSLQRVREYLQKRDEQKLRSAIERGQLAQEAGKALDVRNEITDETELAGFDIGRNFQIGIQGIHQTLEGFSQEYTAALRNGATNTDRHKLYQNAINDIGIGITDLVLPDAYKQQLRKQALEQLDLFVKVRSQADKGYAQEQYDKTRAQAGHALSISLIGAAAIKDTKAAQTAIQSVYETMYAAAYAAGHLEDARKRASESTRDAIIGLVQHFDVTDQQQVQARNLLLQVGEGTLRQYLESDDYNAVQSEFSKATTAIRDYEGLQLNLEMSDWEQRVSSGEAIPRSEYDGKVQAAIKHYRDGKLNMSDLEQYINKVTNLYERQQNMVAQAARDAAAAERDGTNVVQELTGMSLAEADTRGKGTQWQKAWKQQAMLMAQGNPTQAGFILLGVANQNRSPELAREAAQMASREFVYFIENTDPQQFNNSSNNKAAFDGFQQWFGLYKQADPAVRDSYLQGLGSDNAALVTEVLKQNPNATLAEVIQFKQQWKKYGGTERQRLVSKAVDGDWTKPLTPTWSLGFTGQFNLYTDKYEKRAADFNAGIAKQIYQSLTTDIVTQGVAVSSPEGAIAYMRGQGLILETGNQSLVFNKQNRQRLRQAVGITEDSQLASEVMQNYLEKVAKKFDTEASAVVVDGTWDDANRLRFLVFQKDGTHKVMFENWSDIKATAKQMTAERQEQQEQQVYSTPPITGVAWGKQLKDLKAVQARQQAQQAQQAKYTKANLQAAAARAAKVKQNMQQKAAPIVPAPTASTKTSNSTNSPPAGSRSGRIAILETEIRNEKAALAAAKQKGNKAEIADREANLRAIERELKQMR